MAVTHIVPQGCNWSQGFDIFACSLCAVCNDAISRKWARIIVKKMKAWHGKYGKGGGTHNAQIDFLLGLVSIKSSSKELVENSMTKNFSMLLYMCRKRCCFYLPGQSCHLSTRNGMNPSARTKLSMLNVMAKFLTRNRAANHLECSSKTIGK